MGRFCLLFLFVSGHLIAATQLGKPLAFKTHSGGKPHVGVSYTYDTDPDGPSYFFTYLPIVAASETNRLLRWNFYQRSSDQFLLAWVPERKVRLSVLQAVLQGAKQSAIIEAILRGQKGGAAGEVFFVLADDTNAPIYHISISQLCAQLPSSFHDLTHGRACDDVKL